MKHNINSIIIILGCLLIVVLSIKCLNSISLENFKTADEYYGLLDDIPEDKELDIPIAKDYIPPDDTYHECPSKVTMRYYEDDKKTDNYILVEDLITKDSPTYIPQISKYNLSLL